MTDRTGVDASTPQTARIWNYLLGGVDNYAVDRAVGDEIIAGLPHLAENARLSRAFLNRAVRYLAGDAGVRQFLDVGSGLPAASATHEVARGVARDARVVYVDYDPLVAAHARVLLRRDGSEHSAERAAGAEGAEGGNAIDYLNADMRDAATILRDASRTLDLTEPVGLLLMGVLGHVESDAEAKAIVDALLDGLAPGSYLALYDGSDTSAANNEAVRIWNLSANPKYHLRSPARLAALFDDLDLIEPCVVSVTHWHPENAAGPRPDAIDQYCGVGRKPVR
ncbi:SAM-dependent methyltransferase [Cryptosporangium phraense]|uniref:SAM-dependent methyltransferase n=1 Tax=Cryptosporangium phraense TaxID=2593070 RepID=A0A545ATQ6_9ACTN|nr:SAM-dependent methyltransferase [Cryptosporangium phraense]TQS44720.1 SAM-dependent methyltransferase [Cryptosporangium phraense]